MMRVGALKIKLFISDSNSLKSKRSVIKALKDKILNNFNVSITEVDSHDKWQSSSLGVAAVGASKDVVDALLNKVIEFVGHDGRVQVVDFEMEIL